VKCWSCAKEIPDAAKFCPHCEAPAEDEITQEDVDLVMGLLNEMDPDARNQIVELVQRSESGEAFVNQIMVGNCPRCGSARTDDCENDIDIDDPCIGRCADCGQYWCCDCDQLFDDQIQASSHECPVWDAMEEESDEV
jgi:hypothetical protein